VKNSMREVPPLTHLYFYLTEGCNMACRHCWIAPQFDRTGTSRSLSTELFEQAIMEAKPLGLTNIKLSGGEPLLHPRVRELLEITRREELTLNLETNGMLLTRELAEEIAKSPGCTISVSLDGVDRETNDWIRGVAGSFDGARKGIENLVASGIKPQIIMTLMRRNASQMEEMVSLAESLGAGSLKFNLVQPTARGEELANSGETLQVDELIAMGRFMEKEIAPKSKLEIFFDLPYAFRALGSISRGEGCGRCNIFNIMGVLASGHYALCGIGYHVPELVFGEVGKDNLFELWRDDQVLKLLRTGLPKKMEGICSRCLMRHLCLGSCIAQNYYRTRNLWAPYWFCQDAWEKDMFPRTRIY